MTTSKGGQPTVRACATGGRGAASIKVAVFLCCILAAACAGDSGRPGPADDADEAGIARADMGGSGSAEGVGTKADASGDGVGALDVGVGAVGQQADGANGGAGANAASHTPATLPRGTTPSARMFNEHGLRLLAERRYDDAAGAFARATRALPFDTELRNNYGWALYLAGRRAEAERELLEVITQTPDRAIAYANLGEARLQRQDTMAAITAYRRFLQLNTDPRRAQIAQERLKEISGTASGNEE